MSTPVQKFEREYRLAKLSSDVELLCSQLQQTYGPSLPIWFLGSGRLWTNHGNMAQIFSLRALRDSAIDLISFEGLIGGRSILWDVMQADMFYYEVHSNFSDVCIEDEYGHYSRLGAGKICRELNDLMEIMPDFLDSRVE